MARVPDWIKKKLPALSQYQKVFRTTYARGLHTVCKEAKCPNRGEGESFGTATVLILGDTCTRNCAFCGVSHGLPGPLNPDEPELIAASVAELGLSHAVITSVTRDDLPDGGAAVFARTVEAIRKKVPATTVEVLIPDFKGKRESLQAVIDAGPEIINHNVETVERLYKELRASASYPRSLEILKLVAEAGIIAKSGLMVGVGETRDEITKLMTDLAKAGCSVLTVGQYLQPSKSHYQVIRYYEPEEFQQLEELGIQSGLKKVVAGPLVRSSYKSGDVYRELKH